MAAFASLVQAFESSFTELGAAGLEYCTEETGLDIPLEGTWQIGGTLRPLCLSTHSVNAAHAAHSTYSARTAYFASLPTLPTLPLYTSYQYRPTLHTTTHSALYTFLRTVQYYPLPSQNQIWNK